ncbi:MAG: hypothetical protein GF344_12480, partial [Chitinivibrionales bacterium]|nr:hypothetical protein [Chitinivibrionales bacterium]MBD3357572.1 hypothetical protein [Chitinivibrionales bacterium]
MPNGSNHVQPGAIIRAEDWNRLVDQYHDIERRLSDIEQVTNPRGVAIYRPDPSDSLVIGTELRIVGRNFGLPSQNNVLLDRSVRIGAFGAGSNDNLLIIASIPNVGNVSEDGRLVPLTVSNLFGSATTWFHLRQPELTIPTGTLDITLVATPEGERLAAGGTYLFEYRVRARTSMDEIYALSPRVDTDWSARVVDDSGAPVEPQEVFIAQPEDAARGTVVTVRVEVMIPAGTPDGTIGELVLNVTSKRNPEGLFRRSNARAIEVGEEAPPPESLGLSLGSVFAPARRD